MCNEMEWVPVARQLPPDGLVVETKIDDEHGLRNQAHLRWSGTLWWLPDDSMYVYYTPTHWRAV